MYTPVASSELIAGRFHPKVHKLDSPEGPVAQSIAYVQEQRMTSYMVC